MKIACCFSGHARQWKETLPFWRENLFNHYDTDIFFHLWDTIQVKKPGVCLGDFDWGAITTEPLNVDELTDAFYPLTIVTENADAMYAKFIEASAWIYPLRNEFLLSHPEHVNLLKNRPTANFAMWYKRQEVMRLKSEQEERQGYFYDAVVLSRTDFRLDEPFVFVKDADFLTTGPWPNVAHDGYSNYEEGLNDLWTFGPSKLMDKYANLYSCISDVAAWLRHHYDVERILNAHKMPHFNLITQGVPYIKSNKQCGILTQ